MAALTRPDMPEASMISDDLLRLIFTVCHPARDREVQVALALRPLCDLSTAEVARALLVSEPAMAKRLTRGRRKIADAAIPYQTPSAPDLPFRLAGVVSTIYIVFTEGHDAVVGGASERTALCDQAIRLARLTLGLLPEHPSVTGLLALMLLQDSRRRARLGPESDVILLRDQDRSLWDRARIDEGMALLGRALRSTPTAPDPYVVQAAIAACHAVAPTWEPTNWAAIVSRHDVLLSVHDTPVVRLNRAVALSERDGPAAGLAELDALAGTGSGVFQLVAERPSPVGRLADQLPVSRPAVSQHLRVLRNAGLVGEDRAGIRHVYRLDTAGLQILRSYLDSFWERSLASFKEVVEEPDRSRPSDPPRPEETGPVQAVAATTAGS